MKWALAAVLVTVAAVVVVIVLAVSSTRDTVPDDLRTCAIAGGAGVMRSDADLGARVRYDVGAGTVREVERARLGDDDVAVVLQGADFRLLVLAGRKSPGLGGDLPRRVFERTSEYALVVKQSGASDDLLRDCIARAGGPRSAP